MKHINELIKKVSVGIGILVMMCFLSIPSLGQKAGTLDTSFGNDGVVYCETLYDQLDYPSPIMDSQGRILTISSLTNGSGFVLIRCLMDGSFDHNFGDNGHVFYESDVSINCNLILIQQDDKILVAGTIQHIPDTSLYPLNDFFITRFVGDGSLDISFGEKGSLIMCLENDFFSADLALQEDGKIVVSGGTGTYSWTNGNTDVVLIRILPGGQPDSTFGIAGKVLTDLSDFGWDIDQGGPMTIQPDGKIVVAAKNGTWYNGLGFFAIVRYKSNGLLDSSFATNGISIDTMSYVSVSADISLTENLSIIVAGKEGDVFGGGPFLTLRQYTPDGFLDPDFANDGIYKSELDGNSRTLSDLKIQSDQKILATGWWGNNDGVNLLLMRLTPQGEADTTFASRGMAIHKFDEFYFYGKKVSLYPDGKITVAGTTFNEIDNTSKVFIARFYNDGNTSVEKESIERQSNFEVYPNPASGNLNIAFRGIDNNVVIAMTDISGKVAFKKTVSVLQNVVVNTDDFLAGIYFIQVQSENSIQTKKVFISK